jgi:DNA repair protein RecO (recombination protein O)
MPGLSPRKTLETDALVVRAVSYGEADLILTYVTETHGKLSANVRGARKSRRRAQGAHEPFHTVRILAEDRGGDMVSVKDARVVQVRTGILGSLAALEAGGLALRWLRHLVPVRHAEPRAWATIQTLLDALDAAPSEPRVPLAVAGVRLLSDVGYGLDLSRCVVCGRACPEGKPACVDPGRGGLVCLSCGGARHVLSPETRRLARLAQEGQLVELTRPEADAVLSLVEAAMAAHGDFDAR